MKPSRGVAVCQLQTSILLRRTAGTRSIAAVRLRQTAVATGSRHAMANWRSSSLQGSARLKNHRSVLAADAWTHFLMANSRNIMPSGRRLAAAAKSVQNSAQ